MVAPRRNLSPSTEAALWVLSNGRCYAPGCPIPVIVEVRPGVYRKNAQVAHIHAVRPSWPRYQPLPAEERESFGNLLLLCLAHHSEVDDRRTGERRYPAELLRTWKRNHERENAHALAALGPISEDELAEILTSVFTPPLERLKEIADQLEQTGTLNARSVMHLNEVIEALQMTSFGIDARSTRALAFAAETLGTDGFRQSAAALGHAAEVLPAVVDRMARQTRRLGE
jgi:hypothetical protein